MPRSPVRTGGPSSAKGRADRAEFLPSLPHKTGEKGTVGSCPLGRTEGVAAQTRRGAGRTRGLEEERRRAGRREARPLGPRRGRPAASSLGRERGPRLLPGAAGRKMETHISCLFPELLAMIFGYLDVRDKGRAAQVCTAWRDAAYHKSVWRGVEAKLHLRRANPSLFPSLQARGIRRVQILSLRRSLSYVIQGMANIESLNLSGCYNLTDNGLGHAFVQEIGSLRALNLSLCKQITDSSLGRIAQYLKGLEVLELGGCSNITNTGLLLIAWGLQRLKSLNLRSCRHLSDVGIGHLAGMTRSAAEGCLGLEQLTLQDCQKLTDLSLKHISRGLTGLRLLNLSFCGGISDAGLLHLSHMGSLRSLNLRSCDNISDTGIMHLAMGSLRLSGLDVSFCDKVGDQSLAYIAQGLDGLKSLSLCSCHISDDGINRMVRQMHGLRTLNIGQCVRITDKGLELIAEHLSQLTGIDLYGCTRITKRGLERITQLPCLKVLNLGLWQMTDSEKVR